MGQIYLIDYNKCLTTKEMQDCCTVDDGIGNRIGVPECTVENTLKLLEDYNKFVSKTYLDSIENIDFDTIFDFMPKENMNLEPFKYEPDFLDEIEIVQNNRIEREIRNAENTYSEAEINQNDNNYFPVFPEPEVLNDGDELTDDLKHEAEATVYEAPNLPGDDCNEPIPEVSDDEFYSLKYRSSLKDNSMHLNQFNQEEEHLLEQKPSNLIPEVLSSILPLLGNVAEPVPNQDVKIVKPNIDLPDNLPDIVEHDPLYFTKLLDNSTQRQQEQESVKNDNLDNVLNIQKADIVGLKRDYVPSSQNVANDDVNPNESNPIDPSPSEVKNLPSIDISSKISEVMPPIIKNTDVNLQLENTSVEIYNEKKEYQNAVNGDKPAQEMNQMSYLYVDPNARINTNEFQDDKQKFQMGNIDLQTSQHSTVNSNYNQQPCVPAYSQVIGSPIQMPQPQYSYDPNQAAKFAQIIPMPVQRPYIVPPYNLIQANYGLQPFASQFSTSYNTLMNNAPNLAPAPNIVQNSAMGGQYYVCNPIPAPANYIGNMPAVEVRESLDTFSPNLQDLLSDSVDFQESM